MSRRLMIGLGFALLPAAIASILVGHFFTRTLRDALAYGPDEITYWRQVQAFAVAGFGSGYFNVHERPAPAGFSRFGPHGPAFPIAYGTIARLTGWRPYSAPLIGAALIGLALGVLSVAARLPPLLTMSVVATFWPMLLYLPSTMQEPLHYAIAAICALALSRVCGGQARLWEVAAWAVSLLLAACVRQSWALALVPIALVLPVAASSTLRLSAVTLSLVLAVLSYAVFGWLASPYPGSPMSESLASGIAFRPLGLAIVSRVIRNVAEFASPVPILDLCVRVATVFLIGVAAMQGITAKDVTRRRVAVAIAGWLGVTVAALMAFGSIEPGRDIRILGPAVFVALLLWASAGARRLLGAALAVQLAIAPTALGRFVGMHEPRFFGDHTRHVTFAREVRDVLRFRPGEPAWANTLLVGVDLAQDQAMLGLPAGVGTSAVLDWNAITYPPRSRYVLLGPRDRAMLPTHVDLIPLARTLVGVLYENPAGRR